MPVPTPVATTDKRRTITLTNRPPIRIVEDRWPVIAWGNDAHQDPGATHGWEIDIRVRCEKPEMNLPTRYLIHANYRVFDKDQDDASHNQKVRVGRLLSDDEAIGDLHKHIIAVGDELRERILNQDMHKFVTIAVDRCFADLSPHDE